MIRTDADFILAVAPLLRILAEMHPAKRTAHLSAYAERRVKEIRAERRELRTEGEA